MAIFPVLQKLTHMPTDIKPKYPQWTQFVKNVKDIVEPDSYRIDGVFIVVVCPPIWELRGIVMWKKEEIREHCPQL